MTKGSVIIVVFVVLLGGLLNQVLTVLVHHGGALLRIELALASLIVQLDHFLVELSLIIYPKVYLPTCPIDKHEIPRDLGIKS